jgi:transposase
MVTVGIDVSKARLDVATLDETRVAPACQQVANTETGIAALVAQLETQPVTLVALEATGPYHARLVAALLAAELPVTLINPAQIKAFRQTLGGRNKTDRSAAVLIARFAQTHAADLERLHPAAPQQAQLRELVRYRADLLKRRTAMSNQQAAAQLQREEHILPLLAADLAHVASQLAVVEPAIQAVLDAIPEAAVLLALPGVGWKTVAVVLAELPVALWGNAKAAAAYAGVHPAQRQSGTRETSRMSKQGNAQLRQALYCAAVPGLRWNPTLAAAFDGLVGRGKPKMVALGAVMHKLLRIMMGTLRAWYRRYDTTPLAALDARATAPALDIAA